MKREYSLNKVEGFNPYDYIDCEGNLSPNAKVCWFLLCHENGRISLKTHPIERISDNYILYPFEVEIRYNPTTPVVTWNGCAVYDEKLDKNEIDELIYEAEQRTIGEALSIAGFGCEIEANLSFLSNEIT